MTNTEAGAETLPFSCACDGTGWVQIGEQEVYTDLGDGYGPRHGGWEPLMERCECSIPPMPERLDEDTDTEGGW